MNLLFSWWTAPVVLWSVIFYWGFLKKESSRIQFLAMGSLGLLGLIHFVYSVTAFIAILIIFFSVRPEKKTTAKVAATIAVTAVIGLLIVKFGAVAGRAYYPADTLFSKFFLPLGISYLVFRIVQYVIDCYRGILKPAGFWRLTAFLFFIPTFPAGPLETFQGFYGNRTAKFDRNLFVFGLRRILLGYFRKLVVVDVLYHYAFGYFLASPPSSKSSAGLAFAFGGLSFFRAYLDLAAYSDIAIGLSALFGFRITENFLSPFTQTNLGEFWRSWHVSLSRWCRNQVYFPVFGITRIPALSTIASMLVIGLWHRMNWQWTTWALYHSAGLISLSYWQRFSKRHARLQAAKLTTTYRFAAGLLTLAFVALGYCFVSVENYSDGVKLFLTGLGLGARQTG